MKYKTKIVKTRMKIYKNYAQKGHYYVVAEEQKAIVEIVQGSEVYVTKIASRHYKSMVQLLKEGPKLQHRPHPLYNFKLSSFLDILVVTGVTKERIYESLEVHQQ